MGVEACNVCHQDLSAATCLEKLQGIIKMNDIFPSSSIRICKNIHQERAHYFYNVCSTSLFMEANELSYYLAIRVQLPQTNISLS